MKQLENVLINSKPTQCDRCKGKIYFVGSGRYKCKTCEKILLDDWGKVKKYQAENTFMTVEGIAQATGVEEENVYIILSREGVTLPRGSKYYLSCERCGCAIREGRFCASCTHEFAGGIQALIKDDLRAALNPDLKGTMHITNRHRR